MEEAPRDLLSGPDLDDGAVLELVEVDCLRAFWSVVRVVSRLVMFRLRQIGVYDNAAPAG
jgi:hypothetical protein